MSCTTVYYWMGATTERFTIPETILESTDVAINPNSGSNQAGAKLDSAWIATNFSVVNKFTFKESKAHTVTVNDGNAHFLIIIPNVLKVTGIGEWVFGLVRTMTPGLHYSSFQVSVNGKQHTAYYLRDLTSLVFPVRQFYFEVSINA